MNDDDEPRPVEEKEVRTMIMLARTIATVQTGSGQGTAAGNNSGRGNKGQQVWMAPGAKNQTQQMGLSVDFPTFFELFAHGGQPVVSLEECLLEWQGKFRALNSGQVDDW